MFTGPDRHTFSLDGEVKALIPAFQLNSSLGSIDASPHPWAMMVDQPPFKRLRFYLSGNTSAEASRQPSYNVRRIS
jgi:hypothetical protein